MLLNIYCLSAMKNMINHIFVDAMTLAVCGFVFVFFSMMAGWEWPFRLADRFIKTWGYQRLTFDEEMAVARHRTERDAK